MSGLFLSKGMFPADFFADTAAFLLRTQREDGLIPWFDGGHADPWDHVEAAMGLSILGEWEAAERAYYWLRDQQLDDGSWWASYLGGSAEALDAESRERRESNFVAYVATGVWHHYLVSKNKDFLLAMWRTVQKAMGFVLQLQTEHGEIHWAVDRQGKAKEDALITGCSSIYKSLECAWNMSVILGEPKTRWLESRERLGDALRNKPERFDRTWESKARYSMDWFYPVLTGAVPKAKAKAHLQARWDEFVKDGMGCHCVSDEPWITVAESCELVMALLAAGDHARAVNLYSWLHQWRADKGQYWTGYQYAEDLMWPDEKPAWTAGAILLAADALTEHTGAHGLFNRVELLEASEDAEAVDARLSGE